MPRGFMEAYGFRSERNPITLDEIFERPDKSDAMAHVDESVDVDLIVAEESNSYAEWRWGRMMMGDLD